MSRPSKQKAKAQQREREKRAERHRRQLADHCADWLFEADAAWNARDMTGARRSLEKILRIRPTHQAANERLAELCFVDRRFGEGLTHYNRLLQNPEWLPVIYQAAVACLSVGRFDQGRSIAADFLKATRSDTGLAQLRADAKLVRDECARLAKRPNRHSDDEPRDGKPTQTAREIVTAGQGARPARRGTTRPVSLLKTAAPPAGPIAERRVTAAPAATLIADRPASADLPAFVDVALPEVRLDLDVDRSAFPNQITDTDVTSVTDVALRVRYAELRLQKGFDELLALGTIRNVEHFHYQLDTVRRVLRDFRGRVLLADEVGLGKTIEACLTLKEYWLRGLVRKALILTPPSLVGQWMDELTSRFGLTPAAADASALRRDGQLWTCLALVVTSLPFARQPVHHEQLCAIDYDLVIVDEAHMLKNRSSASWQLVNGLKKRFLLLLSATPVGNNLTELYNLILLLRPGLLQTEARFRREYGQASALMQATRREKLRGLLREVMVRNTRAHIDLKLPRRLAATQIVPPTPGEAEVLRNLTAIVRGRYDSASSADRWRLTMLQMQAGSGLAALRFGLRDRPNRGDPGELDAVAAIVDRLGESARSAKVEALIALVRRSDEKKIVFTRFRATLDELHVALATAGHRVSIFHGGLSMADKEAAVAAFEADSEILLSSEVGGEGRNLQFCRTVINYDLPWNPVTIEQRVGRVHRIGQTRDVFVFNLCLAGSVEERILSILHDKINLFELVAGEIEMILGHLSDDQDFAGLVMDAWSRSRSRDDEDQAFDELSTRIIDATVAYRQTTDLDRALFSEDYEI
jgi:superfamily II DNA or RNA helicase